MNNRYNYPWATVGFAESVADYDEEKRRTRCRQANEPAQNKTNSTMRDRANFIQITGKLSVGFGLTQHHARISKYPDSESLAKGC